MKKIIFLIIILSACVASKDRYDLIAEKQNEQLKIGIIKDTTILNFRFGMTEDEVNKHFTELLNNKSISIGDDNEYELIFPFDVITAKAHFTTDYFNDSLYSITLKMEGNDSSEAELIQLKMSSLLMKKYGNPLIVKSLLNENENDYIFIVGNQQIEVVYPFMNMTMVNYIDFRMEKRKLDSDSKQRENNNKEIIKKL